MTARDRRPNAGRSSRLLLPLLVLAVISACSGISPADVAGGVLVGTWGSGDATLTANSGGATLSIPCIGARFAALRLDDTLGFRSTGVVTAAGGLVTVRVGDPYTLTGRVVGERVVLPFPAIVPGAGADTLRLGVDSVHVCNA